VSAETQAAVPQASLWRDRRLWILVAATILSRALAVLVGYLAWSTDWFGHTVKDVYTWTEFFRLCREGFVPYVDFTREYPVGAGLVYWLMSHFVDPRSAPQMALVHAAFMTVGDVLNAILFYAILRDRWPRLALPLALLFSLNLTNVALSLVRFETWVVLLALLGYRAHAQGRPWLASFFWSLGCSLKWYPAFFLAAQEWQAIVVHKRRWQWLGSTLVFLAVNVGVNLPFVIRNLQERGNLQMWFWPYEFHMRRPLYWDTVLGVGQIWLGELRFERHAGAWSLGLMLLAIVLWPRMRLEAKAVLVCVGALVFNRVYSTQFHLWFYPFLILEAALSGPARRRTLLVTLVALDVLNVLVYPLAFALAYGEMQGFWPLSARQHGGPGTVLFSAAIVARALGLLVLAALVLRGARGPSAPGQVVEST
jgi:hypothetical protein